jgi:VanZ family protein
MWLRRLALFVALAWLVVLFYLSHQPILPVPMVFSFQDKVVHALAYGVLAALLLAARRPGADGYSRAQILGSILIASLYGITDEWHQSFVPARSPDFWDWVADTTGAVIAVLLIAHVIRRRRVLRALRSESS